MLVARYIFTCCLLYIYFKLGQVSVQTPVPKCNCLEIILSGSVFTYDFNMFNILFEIGETIAFVFIKLITGQVGFD